MDRSRTAFMHDPLFKKHRTGAGHPECPEKYDAIMSVLKRRELLSHLIELKPRAATEAEILACHTPQYLETVKRDIQSGATNLSTGDTILSPDSLDVALQAAGGVLNAVDAVIENRAANAFCLVRPPGHHATATHGMGFCIFN